MTRNFASLLARSLRTSLRAFAALWTIGAAAFASSHREVPFIAMNPA